MNKNKENYMVLYYKWMIQKVLPKLVLTEVKYQLKLNLWYNLKDKYVIFYQI